MNLGSACVAALIVVGGGFGTASAGTETILSCDFDAEPIDQIIGTGGAIVGQPTAIAFDAYVRSAPFATPSLEMADTWGTGARAVTFEFLNDWEITTGVVDIAMDLEFQSMDNYQISVREFNGASQSFATLRFTLTGGVSHTDADGGAGIITTYSAGTATHLELSFDMDARTCDVLLDGTPVLSDETFGIADRGVGSVLVGLSHDADSTGVFSVDNLVVTATETPSPVDPASWAGTKASYRD
ncbi:MAG: hypothetical protein R3B81_03600 [bacterium]